MGAEDQACLSRKRSVDMQIAKGVGRVLAGFTLLDRNAPCRRKTIW